MKKNKKIKKLILLEADSDKRLLSFLNLLEAVCEDMGIQMTDGTPEYTMGSDY
tara:strand:+ start:1201 stop:1359 length:159 start_codon:yes stop_codon:yes gene_type:complete